MPKAVASLLELIVGSIERGMPKKPSSSSSQSSVVRSISIVRLALVTSVVCTPPSGPPVRFQTTQVSGVPKRASPRSAAARRPSTCSSIHCTLPAEKYVAGGRPALCRMTSPRPSASSALAIESVRVSCQTMALWNGRPVWRSQTIAVSRWLVTPMASRSELAMPACPSALPMTVWVRSQISSGLCSTQPGAGEQLLVLELVLGHGSPVVVEDDEPRARRALVDRADEVTHGPILGAR